MSNILRELEPQKGERRIRELVKDLKIPFKLDGITRIDDTPVHKALREVLANCLVNTDFFVARGIVIRKDMDKIVIENPGYIRTGKEQMLKGGISDPRNKALMKMFNMISIGERAGSGVPDIYAVWNLQGWESPSVEEQYNPDRTIITLTFIKKQAEKEKAIGKAAKTIENKNRVIIFLQGAGSSKAADIAMHIGLSSARTRVILSELIDEGRVHADGNGRSRRYCLPKHG